MQKVDQNLINKTLKIEFNTLEAKGRSVEKLIVFVCLLMYAFQASEPDSRPPPVSFSPPNAPPISAPEVPILTFAIPQSDPRATRTFQPLVGCLSLLQRTNLRNVILHFYSIF